MASAAGNAAQAVGVAGKPHMRVLAVIDYPGKVARCQARVDDTVEGGLGVRWCHRIVQLGPDDELPVDVEAKIAGDT